LNRRVVDAACRVAGAPDAEVIVLHAWDAVGEGMLWAFSGGSDARMSADRDINEIRDARHQAMNRFLAQVRAQNGPGPRLVPRLPRGTAETVIHEQSRQLGADLVVMGTVARTGLSGMFIGNTAENIINSLECPVLAVKPEGFESPLLRG
jgi:universal stress protein E